MYFAGKLARYGKSYLVPSGPGKLGEACTWRVSKNSQPMSGLPSSCVGGMASVLDATRSCRNTPLGRPRPLLPSLIALYTRSQALSWSNLVQSFLKDKTEGFRYRMIASRWHWTCHQ